MVPQILGISANFERDQAYRNLRELIVLVLGVDESEVVPSARFVDLGVDSLSVTQLVVAFGDEFGIGLTDAEVASISTVADAYSYISREH